MKTTFFILLLLTTNIGFCQWEQVNTPLGSVNSKNLIQKDSFLFTITDCGLSYKKALQRDWKLISAQPALCFTSKGDSLIIGNSDGIEIINLSNIDTELVYKKDLDPDYIACVNSNLFVGNKYGVKISSDYGISWQDFNDGLPRTEINEWVDATYVKAIKATEEYIFTGTGYDGLYRSDLNFSKWNRVAANTIKGIVNLIYPHKDSLFVAGDKTIYLSTNKGNDWTVFYSSDSEITSMIKDENEVLIGTVSGIQKSIDNGNSWNSFNLGLTNLYVRNIVKYDSTYVCGVKGHGVFVLNGNSWNAVDNKGINCAEIRSIKSVNDNLIANDYSNVVKYGNNEWMKINPPHASGMQKGWLASMDSTLFLSINRHSPHYPWDSAHIVFSRDYGSTWESFTNNIPYAGGQSHRIKCSNGTVYAYVYDVMYSTSDFGKTWKNLRVPSQFCNHFEDLIIYNSIPFAGACGKQEILRLHNDSEWIEYQKSGLPNNYFLDFAKCEGALFAYMRGGNGMYVSFNDGKDWAKANNGLLYYSFGINDYTYTGTNLFVVNDLGVFFTNDYGQNWQIINDGLKNTYVCAIELFNDTLYVGTQKNGIWKRSLSDFTLVDARKIKEIENMQMFPNPASDFIQLKKPLNSFVTLSIYDLSGKLLYRRSTNSNERIDISKINEGIYVIVLQNNKVTISNKLIIKR